MNITTTSDLLHWRYFLSLEDDLRRLARFVEFDERNFDCFSQEILRLLVAATAEVDVVYKQICLRPPNSPKVGGIQGYQEEIVRTHPSFRDFEVAVPRYNIGAMRRWTNWKSPQSPPEWWSAYNKAKHHRHQHYDRANLKNALNAVAGLFVAVLHPYPKEARRGDLTRSANLLFLADHHILGTPYTGLVRGVEYDV